MKLSGAAFLAAFAALAEARQCVNLTIPLQLSARNAVFNLTTPTSNADATRFALASTRQGSNFTEQYLTGYATVSGRYNISAMYCTPANGSSGLNSTSLGMNGTTFGMNSTSLGSNGTTASNSSSSYNLQILTHGIGFDKTYWDLSYNNYNYSYVNSALARGYHTFSYDRLGIGNSSHADPTNVVQARLETEALIVLTQMLRNGSISGISTKPNKVIHVGHSFGSGQTYTLSAFAPNLTDGIVLTGYSANMTFLPLFNAGGNLEQAYLNQPFRFGNASTAAAFQMLTQQLYLSDLYAPVDFTTLNPLSYPPGYLATANQGASEYQFLLPGYFDPQLGYIAEQTKQPVSTGEMLTIAGAPKMSTFQGPVLVVTGSDDIPFCGGNCTATGGQGASIPANAKMAFANTTSANFEAYIQPNTGHGINLHYNSTGAYTVIQNWLRSHNL